MKTMEVHSSEANLMDLISLGNQPAFERAVHLYTAVLLTKAYKLIKDEESAKDIVQDIFVELWEKKEKINITTNLKAYLLGMLKHRFLRQVSRGNIHDRAMQHLSYRMQEIEKNGILEVMEATEINTTLSEIIEKLPENMQQIFILRDKEYSIKETAKMMGLAEQTIKSYNSELNKRIKKGLLSKHPDISHLILLILISEFIKP